MGCPDSFLEKSGRNPFPSATCALSFRDGLISGVIYSDKPESPEKLLAIINAVEKNTLTIDDALTLTFRSHYGDLSHWHSMAMRGWTGEETYKKIKSQAKEWFEQIVSLKCKPCKGDCEDFFNMGKIAGQLLHMIQDSYSEAHTIRHSRSGKILGYQGYSIQDGHKHGDADSAFGDYESIVNKLPSAAIAMSRSEIMLRAIFEFDCKSKDYSKFNAIFKRIFESESDNIRPFEWEKYTGISEDKYK